MHPNEKEKPRQKQRSLIFPPPASDSNFNFYISGIEETRQEISGSGLALVILVAPSPETALVGGKQGQEAGQEHSEWAELCPGTRGSQECLL